MTDELKNLSTQATAAQATLALHQTTLSQHEAAFLSLQAKLLEGNNDHAKTSDGVASAAGGGGGGEGSGVVVDPQNKSPSDHTDGDGSSSSDDDGAGGVRITAAELLAAQQDLRELKEGLVHLEQVMR